MWGPGGVSQLLTNLQFKKVGGDLFFIFTCGLVVFLFLNLNLHISFIQHGMCPQYKTCFAVSVDCKLVIREAILPSYKSNTPPKKLKLHINN